MINQNQIRHHLMLWFESNARILPWRENKNPYHIWISEIMLQQTRVEAVVDYYNRFIKRLPSVADLANVDDDELYKLWQGLGYYTRAKNLKKAAGIIVEQYSGIIPDTYEQLLELPGIGPYTAGAIASIAFDKKIAAVDGNVMRVISRIYGMKQDITKQSTKEKITKVVNELLPTRRVDIFNQALMELGATICIPNGRPKCNVCPVKSECIAYLSDETNSIPVRTKKKSRTIKQKTVILVKVNDQWVLRRRPNKGLLANLWEFINIDHDKNEIEVKEYLKKHHIIVDSIFALEDTKHIFTHIEWHMKGYLVHGHLVDDLERGYVLAYQNEIIDQYSIPNAFSFYLKIINQDK